MGTVMEIEKAIEQLGSSEFAELSSWWEDFLAQKRHTRSGDKLEAIRRTSGCMDGENGESFEKATAEAGRGIDETHEW
jgi:hypothetical protein